MKFLEDFFKKKSLTKLNNDFIPFATLLDDDVFITKNGHIGQVIEFEINDFKLNQENGFRSFLIETINLFIKDPSFSIHLHTIKKEQEEQSQILSNNPYYFIKNLRNRYQKKEKLLNNNSIVTCLSIIKYGPDLNSSFSNLKEYNISYWKKVDNVISEIRYISSNIVNRMNLYSPRVLSSYFKDNKKCSELISFFGYFTNLENQDYEFKEEAIDVQINKSKFKSDGSKIQIFNSEDKLKKELTIFSSKENPNISMKVLKEIINIPCEIIISESIRFIKSEKERNKLEDQIDILSSSDDVDFLNKIGLSFLKEEQDYIIESSLSFVFISNNKLKSYALSYFIESRFKEYGLLAVREDVFIRNIFYSIFPGNFKFRGRTFINDKTKFGSFVYSYTPIPVDEKLFWNSFLICKLSTLKDNPIYFGIPLENRNIIVSGSNLKGKTTISNFISSLIKDKFENALIYNIEISNKSNSFIDALGGVNYHISFNKAFNNCSLNALDFTFLDKATREKVISEVLILLISSSNRIINTEIIDKVRKISIKIAEDEKPVLYKFKNLFKEYNLDVDLSRWHSVGSDYFLFDNIKDSVLDAQNKSLNFFIDHTIKENIQITNLIVNHLLTKILYTNKDNLKIVIIEEPFFLFRDLFFRAKVKKFIEQAEKSNVIIIFKIEDYSLYSSNINAFESILKAGTQIHFGNNNLKPEYRMIFGLERYQILTIEKLNKIPHSFLLKQRETSFTSRLNLKGLDKILEILSDSSETKTEILRIKEQLQTEDPSKWLSVFYQDLQLQDDDKELSLDIQSELESMAKSQELLD